MKALRTSEYTSAQTTRKSSLGITAVLLWLFACQFAPLPALAQDEDRPTDPVAAVQEAVQEVVEKKPRKPRFLNGAAVGGDLVGLGMKVANSDWSMMEVFARLNFYDKYFPIFEMGIGESDHEGRDIANTFHTRAPYFRIGCDYNFTKRHNGNRVFMGLRYAFSTFNYDLDTGELLTDPVWKTAQPFEEHNLRGNAHWAEIVMGIETKLWSIIRLGWDIRFKLRIHEKYSEIGNPWFIPGYGRRGDGLGWGGTVKLVFDI